MLGKQILTGGGRRESKRDRQIKGRGGRLVWRGRDKEVEVINVKMSLQYFWYAE